MYQIITGYLIFINTIGIIFIAIDKQRAKKGYWRIKENTLLIIAALGGSLGVLFSMRIFHHKTKKPKFYIGIPMIILVQAIVIYMIIKL